MSRTIASSLAVAAVLAVGGLLPGPAAADMTSEPVLEAALEGMDGMAAHVIRVEVGPGAETERHLHPGHVFVYVLEGAVEIDLDGEEPVTVSAGEAIYEPPNSPMIGRNASSEEGATIIVFQVGPDDQPLEVAQPE